MKFIQRKWLFYLFRLRNRIFFPFVLAYVLISSFIIYSLEPETFQTYFNALWWVMTTLTTVGYGDYSPATYAGKAFALFLYITGIGLFGILIGRIVNFLLTVEKWREGGHMKYTGKDHLIIIGWSNKAEIAVQEMLISDPQAEIVIVGEHEETPYSHERVHYVRGMATDEQVLSRTNIRYARGVIVFSHYSHQDQKGIQDPLFLDGKTLLIATAITAIETKHNLNIHVIAEVISEKHIAMFQHVHVDEFIPSNEMISLAAVRSYFSQGTASLYTKLMSHQYGEKLYPISKKNHWWTYRDAFHELLEEGATLIADQNKLNINQRLNERIPDTAKLYVICSEETYQKIK